MIAQDIHVQVNLDWVSIIAIVAGITSVVLGVVAIWQAFTLYRMSREAQQTATDSTQRIDRSVTSIEALYDRLYSDLFSMTKDTVADMRRQFFSIPPTQLVDDLATNTAPQIEQVKSELIAELYGLLEPATTERADLQVDERLNEAVTKAVEQARNVGRDARRDAIRADLLSLIDGLSKKGETPTADDIFFGASELTPPKELRRELQKMKDEGIVTWSDEELSPSTVILRAGSLDV